MDLKEAVAIVNGDSMQPIERRKVDILLGDVRPFHMSYQKEDAEITCLGIRLFRRWHEGG